MALGNPQNDPLVEQQLYADLGPNLGDAMPIQADETGLWAPDHWFTPEDDQLARIGPGAAPPGAPAGLPATAAAPPPADVPPIHPADLAGADIPPDVGVPPPYDFDVAAHAPPPPATVADMPDIAITQEQAPPAVDAITGGAAPGPVTLTPAQHYQQSLHDYAGNLDQIPDPVERRQAINDLYADPARAGEAAELEARRAQEVHERNAQQARELVRQQIETEQKAQEDYRAINAATDAKMAEAMADVDRIVKTKVDPMGGMSPLQRLAGGLAAIVGGLYQGRTGSARNPGLDAVNDIVNRNIAEQKGDLERQLHGAQSKTSILGQEYARHGDMYRAEQTARLAMFRLADEQLAIEQQNYTPGGTMDRTVGKARAAAQAGVATATFDMRAKFQKQELERQEQERKNAETIDKMRHDRVTEQIEWTKALAAKHQDGPEFSTEMLSSLLGPQAPIPPAGKWTLKAYNEWADAVKKGQESSLGEREYGIGDVRPVRDADGNVVGTESVPFVNAPLPGEKTGKVYRAPSTKAAGELRNQKAGVDSANNLIDQMVSGIKKYGGASEYLKSSDWQAMKSNQKALEFALHQAYGVESFRPGILEQVHALMGGQDPTAYAIFQKDAVPGLEAARKNILAKFNSDLRSNEYTGKAYAPDRGETGKELPGLHDRTAEELGEPGPLRRGIDLGADALRHPFSANPAPDTGPNRGPGLGPTGLSMRDSNAVQDLVRQYKVGTPATKARVAESLGAVIAEKRPSLNRGILGLVEGDSPELYQQLFRALPAEERKAIERDNAVKASIGVHQATVPVELIRGVQGGAE